MLKQLSPTKSLFVVVKDILCNAWGQRIAQACEIRQALKQSAKKIDEQIDLLLGRIVESTSTATIAAHERKIERLEKERLFAGRKVGKTDPSKGDLRADAGTLPDLPRKPPQNMGFRRSNLEENSAEIGVLRAFGLFPK